MSVQTIKNLNMATVLQIEGTEKTITIDFTDVRLEGKLLKVLNTARNIQTIYKDDYAALELIEDGIDRMIAESDLMVKILEDLWGGIDNAFGYGITKELFGNCLPNLDRLFDFFDNLSPVLKKSHAETETRMNNIKAKYGADRIKAATGGMNREQRRLAAKLEKKLSATSAEDTTPYEESISASDEE